MSDKPRFDTVSCPLSEMPKRAVEKSREELYKISGRKFPCDCKSYGDCAEAKHQLKDFPWIECLLTKT